MKGARWREVTSETIHSSLQMVKTECSEVEAYKTKNKTKKKNLGALLDGSPHFSVMTV